MSKKTIVFFVGAVLFALVGIAVYAGTDTSQAPTNDTSITSVEVANIQACGEDCSKDCDGNCEKCKDCDGSCDKGCGPGGDKGCGPGGDKGCGPGGGCGGGDN